MRVLAVDPGGRRLGLALGDDAGGIVTPLEVVSVRDRAAAVRRVADAAAAHRVEVVVIGLPTDADGSETPACARSHGLADGLRSLGLEVALQPELLTSDEARRRAAAAGRRRGEPVDDLAAQVIAEEFLAGRRRRDGR